MLLYQKRQAADCQPVLARPNHRWPCILTREIAFSRKILSYRTTRPHYRQARSRNRIQVPCMICWMSRSL
jgi:hypothetical protein